VKNYTTFFVLFFGFTVGSLNGQNSAGAQVGQINKSESWEELNSNALFYYKQGNLSTAIDFSEKALVQAKIEFGDSAQYYSSALSNLAQFYTENANYQVAEKLFLQLLEVRKLFLGENHPSYSRTLSDLAGLYRDMGKYEKSETFYLEAIKIKSNNEEQNLDFAITLNNLGLLYFNMGKYDKAESLYIQTIEVKKKILGVKNFEYSTSLNNLAMLYLEKGEYLKAEELFLRVLEIRKETLGVEHIDYATPLDNLATLYVNMGRFSKAENLYRQAMGIRECILGKEHPAYAISLNNLAVFYVTTGEYSKAEPLYIEASEIQKKVLGIDHPEYAVTLNNLAVFYVKTGEYSKAESLFLQAQDILKNNLGENHSTYGQFLITLGEFYYSIGSYDKALKNYGDGLVIIKTVLGDDNEFFAHATICIASLSIVFGEYGIAEYLYKQALNTIEKTLGKEHQTYASVLLDLADLYCEMKNYTEAEPIYLQAIEIRKKILGDDHPENTRALNNLALLYFNTHDYSKAEPLFKKAQEIESKTFGEENVGYGLSSFNLGLLYFETNNFPKAEYLFSRARDIYFNNIQKNIDFLSEKEMENYLIPLSNIFEIYKNFCLIYYLPKPEIAGEALTTELFTKGLLLNSGMQIRQSILSSGDTAAIRILNEWLNERKVLALQYSKPIAEQMGVNELEKYAEELEKQLTRISEGFRKQKEESKITWQQIQEQIQANSASIEFTSFNYFNKDWTDSTIYAALLLKKDAEYPEFIFQFEEKQLRKTISENASTETDEINQLYTSSSDTNDLYHLIWQPLEPYLQDIDKIYYSPSGLLHTLNLQAIMAPDGKRMGEKYRMEQMSTTRNVVTTSGEPDKSSITLFGGINYDFVPAGKDSIKKDIDFHQPDLSTANRGATEYWYPLDGTLNEVKLIKQQFDENKKSTTLITGEQANEETFKALSGKSPKILHISTHGFFFPDVERKKEDRRMLQLNEEKQVFKIADNPLLRSGLIMAHGNYTWQHQSNPYEKEDGILTAYEISNLDLTNTDLVVLSACETGLGDIKGSEGVFGLQRAFKMAGVDYLMMSLWKVPDKETKEFMNDFYKNWLGGMKIRDAFSATQKMMNQKYPNNPYLWAAFVLVE